MKRVLLKSLILMSLISSICQVSYASETAHIKDRADILSSDDLSELENKSDSLEKSTGVRAVIITENDLSNVDLGEELKIADTVLMLVSKDTGELRVLSNVSQGKLNKDVPTIIEGKVRASLPSGNYAIALNSSEDILTKAVNKKIEEGRSFIKYTPNQYGGNTYADMVVMLKNIVSVILGLLCGFAICCIFKHLYDLRSIKLAEQEDRLEEQREEHTKTVYREREKDAKFKTGAYGNYIKKSVYSGNTSPSHSRHSSSPSSNSSSSSSYDPSADIALQTAITVMLNSTMNQ